MNHIQHTVAVAGAQVADEQAGLFFQLFDGCHMAAGQVHNVDVVAHAGAIGGRVIIAVHMHFFQLANGNFGDVGHQVVGDAVRVLADLSGRMCTDGVEVTQQSNVQLRVCLAAVGQDALGKHLGSAIRVGGCTNREILADGHAGGVAVNRCGGGEDDVMAIVTAHNIQDVQGAVQVVGVILDGLGNAFAHGLVGGKLDHTVNARIFRKDLFNCRMVGHVCFHKLEILTGDLAHTLQGFGAGVVIVICHHNIVTRIEKLHTGMAADVTGAAADQNRHTDRSFTQYGKLLPGFCIFNRASAGFASFPC